MQGVAQWKTLPVPTRLLYRNNVKVEVNWTKNETRITNLHTGKEEILDYSVQDHSFLDNYLCLKKVNVLNDEKTEVLFRVYDIRDGRFLRDIHLFRKTYDYARVEFGEAFVLHATYPKGKALFFILHEDCEGTPSGSEVHIYHGENLKQHKVAPLPDKLLAVWINDDAGELIAVTGKKRAFKKSLADDHLVWELNSEDFSCDWFNYRPELLLNRYLCISGRIDRNPKSWYYILDINVGRILDTFFSNETIGQLSLIDRCKKLSNQSTGNR